VTGGDLPEEERTARVQGERLFQKAESFFPFTLAPQDIAGQLRYPGVVRQPSGRHLQLSLGAFVIAQGVVEMTGSREVGLGGIGPQLRQTSKRLLGRGQTFRSMIAVDRIELIMGVNQLAKCRVE
jgi:hypothetical protein